MGYDPEKHGPGRVVGPGFFERVYAVVGEVPAGRVTTYGDVAAALGLRSVARKVGHALAGIPADREDVPWHRVVNAQGRISRPVSEGSGHEQRQLLADEGVEVDAGGGVISFAAVRFEPG